MEKFEKIVGIPDGDMPGWIQVLRESNLTNQEIDNFLARLNETYAKETGINPIEKVIEEHLAEIEKYILDKHDRVLTPEQREYFRKSIEDSFKK